MNSQFSGYMIRRVIVAIPVLLGLATIAFAIAHVIPGDPAAVAAGESASRETVERIRREFGLDRPLWEQYLAFWRDLAQGDLGRSINSGRQVSMDLSAFFPATLELALFALVVGTTLGIVLGVVASRCADRIGDHLLQVFALSGIAMPQFWLALLLQQAAGVTHWLPITGRLSSNIAPPDRVTGLLTVDALFAGDAAIFVDALSHLLLPGLSLSVVMLAIVMRVTRANMLDVVQRDFIVNARAAGGLPHRLIYYKYALKNALIPVVSTVGLNFGYLLSGSLLVETVFNWPGIGLYLARAATDQDFQPIIGGVLLTGTIYIIVNLVTDLAYGVLDPRVRYT